MREASPNLKGCSAKEGEEEGALLFDVYIPAF